METFKKKRFGLTVKFVFLNDDDVIEENDLVVYSTDRERILSLKNLNIFKETAALGDTVSEHPHRTYIRLI